MSRVAVVTDTTHYLPRDLVRNAGVTEVSLYVREGDTLTREADMPTFDAFYERLRTSAELPTTSQPSIGDFLEVYEPLLADGRDIVSIHLSGAISGTLASARSAAADALTRHPGRRIEVVDSVNACGGMGAIVLAAAAVANAGGDADAVVARAVEVRDRIKIWFAVDTLEFLRRGGRIGAAQAWVGGALKIKPILTLVDGEISPIERVRTQGRAFERLVEYLESRRDAGATTWMIQHIRAPDQAQRLVDRGRAMFGSEPLFVSEIGPVIGAHAGPGVLGVSAIEPELLSGDGRP
jgi:DegV family protein with EDD domain